VGLLRFGFTAIWNHVRELPMHKNRRVRHLLARTNDRAPARDTGKESLGLKGRVQLGDFNINLDQRTVTLRNLELRLTSEEFDVLLFLASHPRSLVTPQPAMATSSTANQRSPRFLRALISLRKKLDAAGPGNHYLRTEPLVIYSFDPAAHSCT
jgi:DNA-binding response OmpR family regulator